MASETKSGNSVCSRRLRTGKRKDEQSLFSLRDGQGRKATHPSKQKLPALQNLDHADRKWRGKIKHMRPQNDGWLCKTTL